MPLICIAALGLIAAYLLDVTGPSTSPSDHPCTGDLS